jgi:hypothetical protein
LRCGVTLFGSFTMRCRSTVCGFGSLCGGFALRCLVTLRGSTRAVRRSPGSFALRGSAAIRGRRLRDG